MSSRRVSHGLRNLVLLWGCLVLAGQPWARPIAAQDLKDLAKDARDSVVLLKTFNRFGRELGNGTGFFVDTGAIATNFHVIQGASRIEAILADGEALPVEGILGTDAGRDLALLKVADRGNSPLELASDVRVEPGEEIVVLGNPLGLAGTLSEGIVAAVRPQGLGQEGGEGPVFQITAPISPGSSGSPVMTLDGRVLGVVTSQYRAGQNLNFAVPARAVSELMQDVAEGRQTRPPSGSVPGSGNLLRNLLISLFFFAALIFAFRRLRQ